MRACRPLNQAMAQAEGAEKGRLRAQWDELFKVVHSEKLGEMAEEFDRVHSVHRALDVGALNYIIPPANLRPYLIDAVERGIAREQESTKLGKQDSGSNHNASGLVSGKGEMDERVLVGTDRSRCPSRE